MRLNIKVTVQLFGRPEQAVYVGSFPATDPLSPILRIAEDVVRAMLRVSNVMVDKAVLRFYVGPSLLAMVHLKPDESNGQLLAA